MDHLRDKKVSLDCPAFVGFFYLSANHIKFTYLIKEIK